MANAQATGRLLGLAVILICLAAPAFCGVISENFNSLSPPALPTGWAATNIAGPDPLWVSQSNLNCTSGNCLFADAAAEVSDKRITTPVMVSGGTTVNFSFRNSINLETAHDGGVFEVSFNGNPFVDVGSVAGFASTSGWYNQTLISGAGNPIGGRLAWSGAETYLTAGSFTASPSDNLQFQFRLGSDNAVTYGNGWRIDDVTISGSGGEVPEPSGWLLAGLPLTGLVLRKRLRRRADCSGCCGGGR